MAVEAVIFDWGGTLTPWHQVDQAALWRQACLPHLPAGRVAETAAAILAAEDELWLAAREFSRSATLEQLLQRAGVALTEGLLASYFEAWEPHTFTHADAERVLLELRRRGIKVGVLSNTMWPRDLHERVFLRDRILHLIDGAVYTSEIPWTKPHPEAFRAAMTAIGASDPASCVFVGDRPYDDVHGAKSMGMKAVLVPNSAVPAFDAAAPDAVINSLSELLPHLDDW